MTPIKYIDFYDLLRLEEDQDVRLENVFFLRKDHAKILAFAIQCGIQGVKPPSNNIWIQETFDSFANMINTTCLNFEARKIKGEAVMGSAISRRGDWLLHTWLTATGNALHDPENNNAYPYVETECEMFQQ